MEIPLTRCGRCLCSEPWNGPAEALQAVETAEEVRSVVEIAAAAHSGDAAAARLAAAEVRSAGAAAVHSVDVAVADLPGIGRDVTRESRNKLRGFANPIPC